MIPGFRTQPRLAPLVSCAGVLFALAFAPASRADRPYAPSRNYALTDIRTHLWFDLDRRAIRGEVAESISVLRNNVSELALDSVDLKIESVEVDGKPAKFSVDPQRLVIALDRPADRGDHHEISIRYEGQPKRGLYFVLPDSAYPHQPTEIWTQGEAEDTRYYIPLYDYPNDRTTSEMILTVPANWITVSNGSLIGVKNEPDGTKTWDWKISEPISTYLISAIAGEFAEKDDSWHGLTLRYLVPRGQESKIDPTFERTKEMLDLFSSKLGVPFPWPQYAQTSVDDFVESGMENASATTLAAANLVHPQLADEEQIGTDDVNSHELAHQWFGDLVTCKDWANLWLNEGFATYFEHYWMEQHYGKDDADYEFWRDQSSWLRRSRLFPVPVVNRHFDDSDEYSGDIYDKAGWVLRMLREKLGDGDFFASLHDYLEANRGQNVVTADLQKAVEQTTSVNVDRFFHQWIYRAGAPEFQVSYTYDSTARQISMDVKQAQSLTGLVELFDVPIDVEIATASGRKIYPIEVSKADETFSFPADSAPLMVVFDRGDQILKKVDFHKSAQLVIYQLKNGETVPDRADAAAALAGDRDDPAAVAALGDAALQDPFWGVRVEALRALGRTGGDDAEHLVLASLAHEKLPWVRETAALTLSAFRDLSLGPKLTEVAANDPAYTVRAAALRSLAAVRAANSFDVLTAAVKEDSPDDLLRSAALGAFGYLGDDRSVPLLLEWSAPGKPLETREAAISSMAVLGKKQKDVTLALLSYLQDSRFMIRRDAISALGIRGDQDAIAPLEQLLKAGQLTQDENGDIQDALAVLKSQTAR
ncbi:MAG TPA: M1 family aminopeptidase [Candidatus Aquilonibacter sp.]|nr:M1 family aminopeptidase [Candidatus Aquilonibacter sp.]